MHKLPLLFAIVLLVAAAKPPFQATARAAARDHLVVIVGTSVHITDISLALLRRAFQGEHAEYSPGKRLVPLNHPPSSAERAEFDRAVLGLAPADVGRFWITRRIRDEGLPPRTFQSSALGVRAVAGYPGAITYMRASVINTSVHVLSIDGVAPGHPRYLLPDL